MIEDKLKEYVRNYLKDQKKYLANHIDIDDEEHVVSIGASVLMTKYPELGGYPGGSFVQSIVNNDLFGAFSRADYINKTAIEFYLRLLYNFSPSYID